MKLFLHRFDRHKIDRIMSRFDFERVHAAMKAVGWVYADETGPGKHLPTLADLKATARRLMEDGCIHDSVNVSTGGFIVERYRTPEQEEDDTPVIQLSFVLENWRSDE